MSPDTSTVIPVDIELPEYSRNIQRAEVNNGNPQSLVSENEQSVKAGGFVGVHICNIFLMFVSIFIVAITVQAINADLTESISQSLVNIEKSAYSLVNTTYETCECTADDWKQDILKNYQVSLDVYCNYTESGTFHNLTTQVAGIFIPRNDINQTCLYPLQKDKLVYFGSTDAFVAEFTKDDSNAARAKTWKDIHSEKNKFGLGFGILLMIISFAIMARISLSRN